MFSKKLSYAVLVLLIVASLLLAACGPTEEPTEAPTEAAPTEAPPVAEPTGGELEIFSWWTAGGEADGLNAMYEVFKSEYPDVEIVNATVAGGAGSNAKAVLATRMQAGDPPDSFQVHAGHELIDSWVAADKMEPVTFIFEENGWLDKYPQGVIDVLSYEGEIWSVPVNIHRSNVLWYNKQIFADNGLEAPATFDDFFAAADTLQAAGVTPLALGDNGIWAATHLMESVLLGTLGPQAYRGLWTGETDWNGAQVQEALDTFARMMDYVNEDHAALSWDQAAQLVADGDAAMTIMGDWAEGYFKSIGLTPNQEFGWAPSPGTDGTFIMLSDSFGLPQGAPHRDNAVAWLELCGSQEGQDAFNPLKGSIPARTDGDRSLYDEYLTSAMDDFSSNEIAPSLAHGAAASEGWVTSFNDAMTLFVTDLDVAGAQSAMAQACTDADVCGAAPPPQAGLSGELEIFSWWTAGGEADGLNAMYEVFAEKYPEVEIVNATVAGGAGSNAKAVLATRMQAGDPPDSFQVHAGHELIDSWVAADKMEPVTFIFEENSWLDKYPQGVIDVLSYDGEIWSVPVNIHRSNVLWYNKQVFADNGLEAPATFDDFFAAADTLQAAGVTPLALGDNGIWAATHLMESVLLGAMGPQAYRGLWTGETDWNGAEVQEALDTFARMMEYVNEDHAALSWDQAAQLVADGDAAMTIMGDWAQGYFTSIGLEADVDYGWAPSPGTGGTFIMLSDSFGLPQGAPHRDNAVAWLTLCGSQEGQDAFNPLKGSIPARTDGDRSLYDVYLLSAMDDFSSNEIAPSLAHGAAASEGWVTAFNDVMTLFVTDLDVAGAQSAMAQACVDAGVCQ
ncbi:MAG: ABC transporter substrate-binding protein [Anaerolineae bacterium]|jgi:glucose/mannose transport system substrate-binding protein